jgi:hypothetical protein
MKGTFTLLVLCVAIKSLLLCVLVVAASSSEVLAACQEEVSSWITIVRAPLGGVVQNFAIALPLGSGGVGTGTKHKIFDDFGSCVSYGVNCTADVYEYYTFSVSSNWSASGTYNNQSFSGVTQSDTEEYYDWRYAGYTKIGNVDWSQNCHGYAFGVTGWPEDGPYGAGILINSPYCYSQQYTYNANIATNTSHTIKILGGAMCSDPYVTWEIVTSSAEKFRESAIYMKSQGCDSGVNINQPHPGASFTMYTKEP